MKKVAVFLSITFLTGCGYGMKYTKSVPLVPSNVMSLKVAEIEDIKRVSRRGEYVGDRPPIIVPHSELDLLNHRPA